MARLNYYIICIFILFCNAYAWSNTNSKTNESGIAKNTLNGILVSQIKPNAPKKYTVKSSDTIIKIANMYLHNLTNWPLLFGTDINNQPKLYSGNVLVLIKSNGYARLMLQSKVLIPKKENIEILKPMIRELTSEQQIKLLNLDKLRNILSKPFIMESPIFNASPQLIAGPEGEDMYSLGDTIYATNFIGQTGDIVSLFSPLKTIYDPDTSEDLGFAVRYNGVAVVDSVDTISVLHIIKMYNTITRGDRVLPVVNTYNTNIALTYSAANIVGKIVYLEGDVSFTAEDNSVAVNRGSNAGVEAGQIMQIYSNRKALDIGSSLTEPKYIQLPPELIGEMIIYKVYPKLSFGLITDSIRPIYLNTVVKSEQQ